jgi:hypothetical protein
MSEEQVTTRDFDILMSDKSVISLRIGICMETESTGTLASKRIGYYSPHYLLSELREELVTMLSGSESKSSED